MPILPFRPGTQFRLTATFLALACPVLPARAQVPGCLVEPLASGGERLRCRDGLLVQAEAGARYRPVDRNRDGRLDGIDLFSRALLIDKPSERGGGFQIRTPHAIAAVRGTSWAVDVTAGGSAVLVLRGGVRVARRGGGGRAGVVLGPGEGVDVAPGGGPLEVKRWAPARAAALLARFGQ